MGKRRGNGGEWSALKDGFGRAVRRLARLTGRKDAPTSEAFRDASMAMCALVAAADGTIDPAETRRVAELIAANEALRNLDKNDLQRRFHDYIDVLRTDAQDGRANVLRVIARVRGNLDEARTVVRLGVSIGGADGRFDPAERTVVREVCAVLGLARADFGL